MNIKITKNGPLEIISEVVNYYVKVRFLNTGYERWASIHMIEKGEVKDKLSPTLFSVGIIGDGPHKASFRNDKGRVVLSPLYGLWSRMIRRCYDPKTQEAQPTYLGCTVHPSWHNFQNFCYSIKSVPGYDLWSDYVLGDLKSMYCLDKDGVIEGNKEYGPTTCQFITKGENTILANKSR